MDRRTGNASPRFGLRRIKSHVRVQSQCVHAKPSFDFYSKQFDGNAEWMEHAGSGVSRKIMVVVDSRFEVRGALQWALTHSVQKQDTLVLVHVKKPSKQGRNSNRDVNPRVYELLHSMKNICQLKRPEVQVEIALVEGKQKGPTIVEEVKKQGVSLLVLGQRKRTVMWRLVMVLARNRIGGGVVEYCIENANCMTVAVRRKGRKLGGYLITTRRHKDFWHLA